jgi:hypothetical protein
LEGVAWAMRNQPPPAVWLRAEPRQVVVAPGGQADLSAILSGFGYAPEYAQPYQGVLRLATNDPSQPTADVPYAVYVEPAPYSVILSLIWR